MFCKVLEVLTKITKYTVPIVTKWVRKAKWQMNTEENLIHFILVVTEMEYFK